MNEKERAQWAEAIKKIDAEDARREQKAKEYNDENDDNVRPITEEDKRKQKLKLDRKNAIKLIEELGLQTTEQGGAKFNLPNAVKLYRYRHKDQLSFDSFTGRSYWSDKPMPLQKMIDDNDTIDFLKGKQSINRLIYGQMRSGIQEFTPFTGGKKEDLNEAADLVAFEGEFNGMQLWLKKLAKQGTISDDNPNPHHFLFQKYCGVLPSKYAEQASKNFCLALFNRVFDPGCKLDEVFVLIGPQGNLKSTFWKIFGGPGGDKPEYYSETIRPMGDHKLIEEVQAKAIIELSELCSLGGDSATANKAKAVISRSVDTYRRPYDRMPGNYKRSSVFVASTNDLKFLTDETGNRRYVCLQTHGEIDTKGLIKELPNIFAAAYRDYLAGMSYWEYDRKEQEKQNRRLRLEDPDEWIVESYLEGISEDKTTYNSDISGKTDDQRPKFTSVNILEAANRNHMYFKSKNPADKIGRILSRHPDVEKYGIYKNKQVWTIKRREKLEDDAERGDIPF